MDGSIRTVVCFFLTVISTVHGHLCLLSPPQRGSLEGINKPGSNSCFQVKEPCGSVPSPNITWVALRAGFDFTVTFQKNLDHWNKTTPGYFNISMIEDSTSHHLAIVADTGEPSLTLYPQTIKVPYPAHHKTNVLMELQVVYVTNNPKAPPAFYQCADVLVVGGNL